MRVHLDFIADETLETALIHTGNPVTGHRVKDIDLVPTTVVDLPQGPTRLADILTFESYAAVTGGTFNERAQLEIGRHLYEQTFAKLPSNLRAQLDRDAEVDVFIRADDEFILRLPWPLLVYRGIFLCAKGWSVSLSGNADQVSVELPPSPRTLVIAPQPAGLGATMADEHLRQLEERLFAHDRRMTWGSHMKRVDTWQAFSRELTDFDPEIVYYYGHAAAETGSTQLAFAEEDSATLIMIPVVDFARKLREVQPPPKIVYVNCCSGDAGGFLGAGRQLEDFVPIVVTTRTVAEVKAAMAQALTFWDDVLLRGISPQRSVAALYSKLDDLNLRTSDVRWLTPVLHSHCNSWSATPPKVADRLSHDPHWHLKIDRVVQYSVVAEQTRQMLREQKPRSHAFIWYGREGEGMEIFHQRLNVELRESLPQRTYLYEVRPEWPAEFHSVHRSCQDMLLEAFQVGTLDDVPGRIRAKTAGAIGMQTLVYVRHEPVRSAKVLSSSNLLAYLEWWDTQFVPLLERQQFALLGISFEVRKPEAFLERMERLEATNFTATVVRILNQLDRLARRDLIDFLNTHSIRLPPIRREETLSRILDETDGRYDLTVEKLKNLIELAWESEEPAAVDIAEDEEEDW